MLFCAQTALGQERKLLRAVKSETGIKVDGLLNESFWQSAPEAVGFVQQEPFNGRASSYATKVYVGYDDDALYIGAVILDPVRDSISFELHERDNIGLADYFGVMLDPFNDGLTGFGFVVTSRGVQGDLKLNNWDEEDYSWDAVWKSAVIVSDSGWTAEMAIPYSALRFPSKATQRWGVNFYRSVQRRREYSTWKIIDVNKSGMISQAGELLIEDELKPPMRLSATPYLSAMTSHNSKSTKWSSGYNYGMDLKLGLNESFTLDMTLIPDFGQVESDELVYSLTPFEVYYEEKRPFFTEGTELFNKGNVFYSRRIGDTPQNYNTIASSYSDSLIVKNPETVQLINAAKLSGKTRRGFGVGVFNAVTANTWAEVRPANELKRIKTEPYTNYNMVVVEQALANNSQISFYNTNVVQPDSNRMANVTGTEMVFRNSKSTREFYTMFNLSQKFNSNEKARFGERLLMSYAKIDGQFRPEIWLNAMTDTYDPNDMGYQKNNNEISNGLNLRYNFYEPNNWRLRWFNRIYFNQYYQYRPLKFSVLEIGGESRLTTVKQLSLGGNFNFYPLGKLDFFEARTKGRYFKKPLSFNIGFWGSPDYRKKFLIDYRAGIKVFPEWKLVNWWLSLSPRWRIKENIMLVPELAFDYYRNDIGYATKITAENETQHILFGKRDVKNITSSISFDYVFNPHAALAFNLRHYWLLVDFKDFYRLKEDAGLESFDYSTSLDFAVNSFNIDMVYKWNFAPGSELLLVWKNAVYTILDGASVDKDYFTNLENTFDSPVGNSFSIKLLYYIDWQNIKKLR